MGRDSFHICHSCRVYQDNGYGSYGTWIDTHTTLAGFDEEAKKEPLHATLGKNQNARNFLAAHDGHKVEWFHSDMIDDHRPESLFDKTPDYTQVPHEHHFGCNCTLLGKAAKV